MRKPTRNWSILRKWRTPDRRRRHSRRSRRSRVPSLNMDTLEIHLWQSRFPSILEKRKEGTSVRAMSATGEELRVTFPLRNESSVIRNNSLSPIQEVRVSRITGYLWRVSLPVLFLRLDPLHNPQRPFLLLFIMGNKPSSNQIKLRWRNPSIPENSIFPVQTSSILPTEIFPPNHPPFLHLPFY